MSPEQMRSGKLADERSDIWSLGVICYELLAGKVPFSAANLPDLAVRIALEAPTPISALREEVPAALSRAVQRCLEKDNTRRFPNVAELARALAPFGPARALAHAERAERILQMTQLPKARITPLLSTSSRSVTPLGSHARLRGAPSNKGIASSPKLPKVALWLAGALLLGALALIALRWGQGMQPSAAQAPENAARETRANAASVGVTKPAAIVQPAVRELSKPPENVAGAQPIAANASEEEPPAGQAPPELPLSAAPLRRPPASAKAAKPARPAPTAQRKLEPKPITPPAAAPKGKDSELDSLGGRL